MTRVLKNLLCSGFAVVLAVGVARAGNVEPEAVAPAPEPQKFWTNQTKITFAVTGAIRSLDAAQTCYGLRNQGHEDWIPTKSCAASTSIIMAGQPLATWGQYLLWRRHHYRLAKWSPWVGAAGNALAVGLTARSHGGFWLRASRPSRIAATSR